MKRIRSFIMLIFLLALLFCAASGNVGSAQTQVESFGNEPIRIKADFVAPDGKISLGEKSLDGKTECLVSLEWNGEAYLTICYESGHDGVSAYQISNGQDFSLFITESGDYTISVRNGTRKDIKNIAGTIEFAPMREAIVIEAAGLRSYDDGSPYIYSTRENVTDRTIVRTRTFMLAYDFEGKPLKLYWYSSDTSSIMTYGYLVDSDETIMPGQENDNEGGWSLNILGKDQNVGKIAFVLICDKEVVFSDGSKWVNPQYDGWLKLYEGQEINIAELEGYYPFVEITE